MGLLSGQYSHPPEDDPQPPETAGGGEGGEKKKEDKKPKVGIFVQVCVLNSKLQSLLFFLLQEQKGIPPSMFKALIGRGHPEFSTMRQQVCHSIPQYTIVCYSIQYLFCYSVLQYTTVYYSVLQYTTVYYSVLQYTTVYYSVSQYTTVYYSVLQYTTVYYSVS